MAHVHRRRRRPGNGGTHDVRVAKCLLRADSLYRMNWSVGRMRGIHGFESAWRRLLDRTSPERALPGSAYTCWRFRKK